MASLELIAAPRPGPRSTRFAAVAAAVLVALSLLLVGGAPQAEAATASPKGLTVVGSTATSLSLDWKAVSGAPRYRVQYSTSASMAKASYRRFTASKGKLTGLQPGTRYYVKVRVITGGGKNLSPYSAAVRASTKATKPARAGGTLRVGSFNVKCFNCIGDQPNERTWWERRGEVVSTILGQDVDVIGVQEASQAWLPEQRGGKGQDLSQFEDLRNRLGGSWEVTNTNRNNCVKAKTPTGCSYKDQGASQGTRILYDSSSVELLDNGSKLLTSPDRNRYLAWAELRQRSTGKKFFFATAHLEPNSDWELHRTEAQEMAQEIDKQNTGNLPTFITGDLNSSKNSKKPSGAVANSVYDVLVGENGYVEPLGNASGTRTDPVGATVEKRINTCLSSFNNFNPAPSPIYCSGPKARPNGTYLDYIFTSPKVDVLEWETVAKINADGTAYVGKQASDHNMIRASVVLP